MKVCQRCKGLIDSSKFNYKIKAKNLLSPYCKDCSREYVKNHYRANREYYLKKANIRNKKIRQEIKKYIWDFLKLNKCVDCGENNPIVLEFDHVKEKSFTISRHAKDHTLEQVKLEIDKCEVRCANCHRVRTANQFGWSRMPL